MMAPLLAAGLAGFVFGLLGGLVFLTVESEKRLAAMRAKALLDVELETCPDGGWRRVEWGGELKPGQAVKITVNGETVLRESGNAEGGQPC